jgi:short-subunit dehydrogenase
MTKQKLNVVVTGASSGIGRATAIEMAGRGHRVFAAARRVTVLETLEREHPNVVALELDVTDGASVEQAARRVGELTDGGGADVLVNSAGYALAGAVETLPGEAVEHQFATNVFGLLEVTRAFLPGMRARGSGTVINVSSIVGRMVFPGMGVYAASKFAVEALSDALRLELAPFGVSVVLIEPMFVATAIGEASQEQASAFTPNVDSYEQVNAKTLEYVSSEVAKGIPAEAVARRIADAAAARRPKARYALPLRARFIIPLMRGLPDGAADRAKLAVVGRG